MHDDMDCRGCAECTPSWPWRWSVVPLAMAKSLGLFVDMIYTHISAWHNHRIDQSDFRAEATLAIETITGE